MKKVICKAEYPIVFVFGGALYFLIEILWRGFSHWTMAICGGTCFLVLYLCDGKLQKISLAKKCIVGSSLITCIEFLTGCIVNLTFKMNVWDYSDKLFNIKGQICLLYSFLWFLLCFPAFFVSGFLRNKLFR